MNFESFIPGILATVISGVVLALLFFLVREKLYPLPDIAGKWYVEICTKHTSYKPYVGMVLRYEAMLWREGNRIRGTVEKSYENSSTGERNYVGKNRTRGVVDGYLEKRYFAKDRLCLHVVEDGHGRESTNFYNMIIRSDKKMLGKFDSLVAKQYGEVTWQRDMF